MPTYTIYIEGYQATGESSRASFIGTAQGTSFKNACANYAASHPDFKADYNTTRNTHWGCRLFETLSDAQKSFG